jgi:hypothetical protein
MWKNKQIEYVLLLALAHCCLLLGPHATRCLLHCMWTSAPCLLVIRDMG